MDYEKKYKEAFEEAKAIHNFSSNIAEIKRMEQIFPELAESEDEKIRKALITHCRNTRCVTEEGAERIAKWIAWLEKQDEIDKASYEIAEKEKREFVGDGFIKCYADFQDFKEGETYWLEYVGNDNYNVRSDNLLGKTYHITPCQLYTVFKKQTWLEKQGEQKPTDKVEPKFKVGDWIFIEEVKGYKNGPFQIKTVDSFGYSFDEYHTIPFMYEDLLSNWTIQNARDGDVLSDGTTIFIFKDLLSDGSVMSYCDYDTDSGESDAFCPLSVNLVCSKITPATKEQRDLLFTKMKEAGYEWDEDNKALKKIGQKPVITIPKFKVGDKVYAIRDRFECTIESIDETTYYGDTTNFDIKDQDNWRLVEQKPSWSEEDEEMIDNIIDYMKPMPIFFESTKGKSGKEYTKEFVKNAIKWLKCLQPQSHWKPSEEQMAALSSPTGNLH